MDKVETLTFFPSRSIAILPPPVEIGTAGPNTSMGVFRFGLGEEVPSTRDMAHDKTGRIAWGMGGRWKTWGEREGCGEDRDSRGELGRDLFGVGN